MSSYKNLNVYLTCLSKLECSCSAFFPSNYFYTKSSEHLWRLVLVMQIASNIDQMWFIILGMTSVSSYRRATLCWTKCCMKSIYIHGKLLINYVWTQSKSFRKRDSGRCYTTQLIKRATRKLQKYFDVPVTQCSHVGEQSTFVDE